MCSLNFVEIILNKVSKETNLKIFICRSSGNRGKILKILDDWAKKLEVEITTFGSNIVEW